MPREVVIVDAVRSPIGRAHKGPPVGVRPADLAGHVVRTLLYRNGPPPVDEVVCAVAAQDAGGFEREIVPWNGVARDGGPRRESSLDKLAALEPVVGPGGRVTAGNSCALNDGAAAVLVASGEKADALGLRPRARIV